MAAKVVSPEEARRIESEWSEQVTKYVNERASGEAKVVQDAFAAQGRQEEASRARIRESAQEAVSRWGGEGEK